MAERESAAERYVRKSIEAARKLRDEVAQLDMEVERLRRSERPDSASLRDAISRRDQIQDEIDAMQRELRLLDPGAGSSKTKGGGDG